LLLIVNVLYEKKSDSDVRCGIRHWPNDFFLLVQVQK